jgi:toxin ParE1/3/4
VKRFKIFISPEAENDLEELWLSIAAENLSAANTFVGKLNRRIVELETMSKRGGSRPDIAPNARILVEGKYLILYHVLNEHVDIIRVIHGAMDLQTLFN